MQYPPRTKTAIPIENANYVKGWLTQLKYNDTRIVITPDGTIWNRHCSKLNYNITPELTHQLHHLQSQLPKDTTLDGGLLHYKHPHHDNTIIIWDILKVEGKLHTGTYAERHNQLLNTTTLKLNDLELPSSNTLYILNNIGYTLDLWMRVKTHPFNKNPNNPYLEGLVFKNPAAKLKQLNTKDNNTNWSVKTRLPTNKYPF